ncbi:MAG TPA: ATP phosphoribosyltransferase [Caulobacteraceae bacterium]|jgi:ATP phosphoribosyltransferase|nr:ATP phosphoribosyltransferase [Caulobacteraceae bacterium]
MSQPLILATPSKGRLKEQAEGWLADCGLPLKGGGSARGYLAQIAGLDEVQVRLASAADIATGLASGEVHLGVTGEDLLREFGDLGAVGVVLLNPLGFGRADLVVAAPQSWVDVETMADVDDVAHAYLARTGRRLRVATKYLVQTRAFFARHGIVDYRLTESGGATEGAPAAGAAELVVDITTSGATLTANHLKPLSDGVILRSQAHLAASVRADWDAERFAYAARLLAILEARARAKELVSLSWPPGQQAQAVTALSPWAEPWPEGAGCLAPRSALFAATAALAAAGVGPVNVTRPDYVFEAESPAARTLAAKLGLPA